MPLPIHPGAPTLFIRRAAYERSGLMRAALDERLGLTPDEFRVEADVITIGPVHDSTAFTALLDELEMFVTSGGTGRKSPSQPHS